MCAVEKWLNHNYFSRGNVNITYRLICTQKSKQFQLLCPLFFAKSWHHGTYNPSLLMQGTYFNEIGLWGQIEKMAIVGEVITH